MSVAPDGGLVGDEMKTGPELKAKTIAAIAARCEHPDHFDRFDRGIRASFTVQEEEPLGLWLICAFTVFLKALFDPLQLFDYVARIFAIDPLALPYRPPGESVGAIGEFDLDIVQLI